MLWRQPCRLRHVGFAGETSAIRTDSSLGEPAITARHHSNGTAIVQPRWDDHK